jgi:hypothetical protein
MVHQQQHYVTNGNDNDSSNSSNNNNILQQQQETTNKYPFPQKLFEILNDPNNNDIIQWLDSGFGFKIIDLHKFTATICSIYFKHTKITSFQRQLNLYGFRRNMEIPCQLAYNHPLFARGNLAQVIRIRRASRSHPIGPLQLYGGTDTDTDTGVDIISTSNNNFNNFNSKESDSGQQLQHRHDQHRRDQHRHDQHRPKVGLKTNPTFASMVFDLPAICESPRKSRSRHVSKRSFEDASSDTSSFSSSFDNGKRREHTVSRDNNKFQRAANNNNNISRTSNNNMKTSMANSSNTVAGDVDTSAVLRTPASLPRLVSFVNDPINFLETAIQTCRSVTDTDADADKPVELYNSSQGTILPSVPVSVFTSTFADNPLFNRDHAKGAADNVWASSFESACSSSSSAVDDDFDSFSYVLDVFFDSNPDELTDVLLLQ